MTTIYNAKYIVGQYNAPAKDEPPVVPVMIRGQFICDSILSAQERAIECARADVLRLDGEDAAAKLDINDATDLACLANAGYYIRWLKDMDDFPKPTEDANESEDAAPTHRTLCLYHARSKAGDWFRWGLVGKAYPLRYYFISSVSVGVDPDEFSEDDATICSKSKSEAESSSSSSSSSESSDSESSEEESSESDDEMPKAAGANCPCGRGTMHLHRTPFRPFATQPQPTGRGRRRNRPRRR